MKKLFFILVVLFCAVSSMAQTKYTLPYDTVIVMKPNGIGYLKGNKGSFTDTVWITTMGVNDSSLRAASTAFVMRAVANGGGGGGSTNTNIGTGYGWAVEGTNNIKTFLQGYGLLLDSLTNTLSARADTLQLATIAQLQHRIDSLAGTITSPVTSVSGNTGSGIVVTPTTGSVVVYADTSKLSTKANVNHVADSLSNVNLFNFTKALAVGDSYTLPTGVPVDSIYIVRTAAKLNFNVTRQAIGGSTTNNLTYFTYYPHPAASTDTSLFVLFGVNNISAGYDGIKTYNKIANAYRSGIANQFLSSAVAANDAAVTKTGTWAATTTWTGYAGKAGPIGGLGEQTSTGTSDLQWTFSGTNVVVGFIGSDGTVLGGTFRTLIDGVLIDTINTNNQTDGFVGSGDVFTYHGVSCVKIYSGLSAGSHTIKVERVSGTLLFDYFGTLKSPSACASAFILSAQKLLTGWVILSGSNYRIDQFNTTIKSVISEFKQIDSKYPVYFIDVNKYINFQFNFQSDNIHWTSDGHKNASFAIYNFLKGNSINDLPQANYYQYGDVSYFNSVQVPYTVNGRTVALAVGPSANRLVSTYPLSSNNIHVGELSGNISGSTTGVNNASLGYASLGVLTSGGFNTAVGSQALGGNTTGIYNTSVGQQSSLGIVGGVANAALGRQALLSNVSGNFNSAFGYQTLFSTTGSNNTGIGVNAGFGIGGGNFNTVIGAFSDVVSGSGSGQLIISNIIYGINGYQTTSPSSTPTSTGSIGIGVTTPTARLMLPAGTATASTAPLKLTTGTATATAEAGALEYTTPQLFFTNGGAQRQEIPQIQQSRVTSQFNKTNDAALASVTGLTSTLVAGRTYRFEIILYTTSNVGGGVQIGLGGTATATAVIAEAILFNAGVSTQARVTALGAIGGVTAVTAAFIKINGTITVNAAGTLTATFAQNASNGTASSVLVGSTFEVTEIL